MKRLATIWLTLLLVASTTAAGIYVNDYSGWKEDVDTFGSPINTITWDEENIVDTAGRALSSLDDSGYTSIAGDAYAGMPGSPMLSSSPDMYVINPGPDGPGSLEDHFIPWSGANVFSDYVPSPEGILTMTFSTRVYGIGAWFLDVEEDYDSSGIEVDGVLYSFGQSQGDQSQSFLGITSLTGFTSVKIHMSSDPGGNGVGIDDLNYALVPVPAAVVIGMLGLGVAGLKLRKYV